MAWDIMDKLLTPVRERLGKGEGNGCFMETVYERAEDWNLGPEAIVYAFSLLSNTSPR
jgi:hypothetical protein